MRPWFERDPELLELELSAFADAGIEAAADEGARAAGLLRLHLTYSFEGEDVRLIADYPDFYPYFRPEVSAPDILLPRHQSPDASRTLCYLGRRTSAWFAGERLAPVLKGQLDHLLAFGRTGDADALAEAEEPQGEPASVYLNWASVPDSYMLVDSGWNIDPAIRSGTFTARCERRRGKAPPLTFLAGLVAAVFDEEGRGLARWDGPVPAELEEEVQGRWTRVASAPLGGVPAIREAVGEQEWSRLRNERGWKRQQSLELAAIIFPEEVRHRVTVDGWGFLMCDVPRLQKGRPRVPATYILRSARAGAHDLAARMPAAAALADKIVVVVGLGAIGAPLALELARSGIRELRLVDHDRMEPSTARRWPIGWPGFGRRKLDALRARLNADYPWTRVVPCNMKVGLATAPGERRQGKVLPELLSGADLAIDMTAEMGVNHLLSDLAREMQIPFLLANATPGAWGGMVARFTGGDACWMCFRHALYESGAIPLPPADMSGEGETQPAACAEPTFTGAAFDLEEISLEAARAAASLLGLKEGYAAGDGQVATLALRDDKGRRIPPKWESFAVPRREGCRCVRGA